MKKHYETHVEDTDKLISVAGPVLDYKSWYEQYRKLMEEQAQRKYGLYTPTSEGDDDDFPSISGMIARYSALGLTNEEMSKNPVWVDKTGNGHDLQMKNFAWKEGSGISDIYPGALVFDGVDDYGVCDNFPILTKEKGYTVVALRQYLVEKSTAYLTANGDSIPNTSFMFEGNNYKDTWNFGKATAIQASLILAIQTSKQYDGVKLNIGTNAEGSNLLQVGKWSKSYSNVAIWELVYLDRDATEEELTKIKDYFVKTYPWLFPDQAWTVTGKTNEDEDRATIANITGNGNDLVLSNFGFVEGSGYNEQGEYAGYLVTDGVDDKVQSSSFTMNEDWTIVGDWELLSKVQINCGIVKSQNVYLYNTANGLLISINNPRSLQSFRTKSLHAICSDGRLYDRNWVEYEYTVDQNFEIIKSSLNIGFNLNNYTQIAFKNLGIYNNQILSKEDCIKAYNYLQTLKAK